MEEMKWFSSSGFLGVLAASISFGFGFALAENSIQPHFLASDSAKRAWHAQNQPHKAFIAW
jgi:hypothetical protein